MVEAFEEFEHFWDLYPKRGPWPNPKKPAKEAFARAVKRGAKVEDLWAGARAYAEFVRAKKIEQKFVCMASTFLNQDRYEGFVEQPKTKNLTKEILLGE